MPASTTTPADTRRPAALAVILYLAFGLLVPLVRLPPLREIAPVLQVALLVIPTAAFMLLQLWLAWTIVRRTPPLPRALFQTALCVGLWFLTLLLVHPFRQCPPSLSVAVSILRPVLLGFWITLAGTFGGIALSRIVRERNVLLPVALIAMPIDYLGAMTPIGFTQNAVARHPQIVSAVSVPVPIIHGLHIHALIGPGDALFIAFFFAAILRLGMNGRGTFWLMYFLLTATMLLVLFFGLPIAALVPMGIAVIAANRPFFTLKREEYFAMTYAGALVIALVVGFYFYSHAHFFASKGDTARDTYHPR